MTIELPLWQQANDYPARLDRMLIAAMHDEGVMNLTSLKVTQRAAGANFSVDVSIGDAIVTGDDQADQGNYYVRSTAVENVVVTAAPGSNSRYDIVVIRVNDAVAGGAAGDNATIAVIAGTASASPTAPATPDSAILLATIGPIATGTASITDSIIADNRVIAGRKDEVGSLKAQSGPSIPSGWLWCDGSAVSRTTYAALFAEVGTSFGVGNGSTTFNLPDFRERDPLARGTTLTTIGATGGSTTAIVVAHTHTGPSHTHLGPDHIHYMNHDHGSVTSSGGSAHSHGPQASGSFLIDVASGGTLADPASGTSIGKMGATDTEAAHTHTVDLPIYNGVTDLGGGGNSTGASGTGATGSTGSSGANANRAPYQVIGGWRIRT